MGKETGNQEVGWYAKHARQVTNLERICRTMGRFYSRAGDSFGVHGSQVTIMSLSKVSCKIYPYYYTVWLTAIIKE